MKISVIVIVLMVFLSACSQSGDNASKALEKIRKQESALLEAADAPLDQAKAITLIESYREFYRQFPEDSNAASMIFKASEILMNTGRPAAAIKALDTLINNYPEWRMLPEAMHLKAFIYDDKLQDMEGARKAYQAVIDRFPGSPLAENARGCLMVLGKSPEDIIKSFEEKRDSTNN